VTLTVLCDRRTGEMGGDPEFDSGGVVGSISNDSDEDRPSRLSRATNPSADGPAMAVRSRSLPAWTGDLASVPGSTELREEVEASGG
jgi:hypothetical protein